jgi:hypothetical protein
MSSQPEEDIRRTLARYCMLVDDGRFDEWAKLFRPEAKFHVLGRTHQGRDELLAFMASAQGNPEARGKHVAINPLIELDSWNGTADCWTDYIFVGGDSQVTSVGRYHDRMIRDGDKVWRFELREIVFAGDEPQLTQPPPG